MKQFINIYLSASFTYTSHPIAVGNVSGASMMVSRKVLDEVGIFDPDFFMYSE